MIWDHTKKSAGKLCGITVFTLLLVLIPAAFFDFYYDLNDDTAIKDIISGAYTGTPSGYSIQMLYPLSWFIALFYRAIPALPWYGLFLCVCQFGVFSLIGLRLLNIARTGREKALSLLLLFVIFEGLFIRQLVIIQYSVTSAICMVGALFLFMTSYKISKASEFLKQNTITICLVILSFMIRPKMCLMLMPFLLLGGIIKWGMEEKIFTVVNFRKYLVLIGVSLLGMTAAYSIDKVAYNSSEWTSFRTFFDARTDLYDFYELPSYDENEEFYSSIGLSRESYTLLENYNFALDESIDSWLIKSISDYQKENAGTKNKLSNTFGFISKNNIKEALWLYKRHLLAGISSFSDESVLEYIVAGGYIISILIIFYGGQKTGYGLALFGIIALMFIRSVLWLYLFMVDRVLERVTIPLLMMELCMLLLFILNGIRKNQKKGLRIFVRAAVFIVPVISLIVNWGNVNKEMQLRTEADKRWNALIDYCTENDNAYYVIDVYSSTSYNGASYSEKIFKDVDNSYKNFDICGGWTAKSPLAKKKLSVSGLRDIQSALYSNKAYFAAACVNDITWLDEYYENRGYSVEAVCIDTVYTSDNDAAFNIYKISKKE